MVLVCSASARADYDFSIPYANFGGPVYHIKGGESPSIQVEYGIHLAGSENPTTSIGVTVELYKDVSGRPELIASELLEVGTADLTPGNTSYYSYQFPLYREKNYALHEGTYYFVVTVDSTGSFSETNESNNSTESVPFGYRIFSGDLYFGAARVSCEWLLINNISYNIDGTVIAYYISNGNGSWNHSWGSNPISFTDIVAGGSTNGDRYSVDLHVENGSTSVGTLQETVTGLPVMLENVRLDQSGMNYDSLMVDLPEGVTAHTRLRGRVHPVGSSRLVFAPAGVVADPGDIEVFASEYFFHSYGLPFYVRVVDSEGGSLSFSLDAASQGICLVGQPYYVHLESRKLLVDKDLRKNAGLPSNDILYFTGYTSTSFINGNGLQGEYGFKSYAELFGDFQTKLRTHFPLGTIEWESFFASVHNGQLVANQLGEGEELPVRFTMAAARECVECPGPLAPGPGTYSLDLTWSVMGEDGAFGGQFEFLVKETTWGPVRNGESTYAKNDGEHGGILYFPGFIATGTGAGSHTLGQYLLGSRSFPDQEELGSLSYLHDANDLDATRGNGYFAGITMGPGALEPQVDPGVGELINDSPLGIMFNGNVGYSDFTPTSHCKYVLRPGGVTGVFNTDFSGPLTVYGYTLQLQSFAFRQVLNRLDDETLINGYYPGRF